VTAITGTIRKRDRGHSVGERHLNDGFLYRLVETIYRWMREREVSRKRLRSRQSELAA